MQTQQADRRSVKMKDSLKRQRPEALAIPDGGSPGVEQGVVEQRVSAADWNAINAALDANGFATITGLLDAEACGAIVRLYPEDKGSAVTFTWHGTVSGAAGGEFVLTEQRPRMQSRASVIPFAARRCRDFRRPPSPGARRQGQLPRQPASRRQRRAQR
jgi:hypothetical protein